MPNAIAFWKTSIDHELEQRMTQRNNVELRYTCSH